MANKALRLFHIGPSPNCMKARIALNFKQIPFEKVDVDPQDRSEVVRVSSQPLTPVLAHGEVVIFDSGAILRYLDARFPDTPRLFSDERERMREIEQWEWIGRTTLTKPTGMVFGAYVRGETDPEIGEQASEMLRECTAPIEKQLADQPFLLGDAITAADVTMAPFLSYGMVPAAAAAASPIAKHFHEHLRLGDGRDRTRAWVGRVMAYDR